MSLLIATLTGLLTNLGAAIGTALGSAAWRRLSFHRPHAAQGASAGTVPDGARVLRRYTLLRRVGPDGAPYRYETTRPVGTVITHPVNGYPERFELTDAPLGDGTFAAEPLDPL